ncbi:MAG: redoxin domain-containing protein [Bacteroidota bacterium]|nr:redoxin domain-containing protein [Bacteroidota bacterium]
MRNLKPGDRVPDLQVQTLQGEFVLANRSPEHFTMLLFYRGIHCPLCKTQVEKLELRLEDFNDLGVEVLCLSVNSQKQAEQTFEEWELEEINLGYEVSLETGREWGLFISEAVKESEPEHFFEPALFLVRPDGTLYSAHIQSIPFVRPDFDRLLRAIKFIIKEEYPAKGKS